VYFLATKTHFLNAFLFLQLMIIVDDAGGFIPALNHSPWDGVTIADFVMPFFLFIVGVSLTLAYKRVPDKLEATKKAVLRALKLFCLGLVLQGGFFHGVHSLTFGVDLTKIRLMGILQRIAIAYLLAAICEIWLKRDDDVDSGLDLLSRYRYQLLGVSDFRSWFQREVILCEMWSQRRYWTSLQCSWNG